MSHAYCNYTVFDDCNLDSVDFSSAELESARFTNCEMKDLLLNSRPEFKSVEYADGELNAVIADEYCDEAIGEESGMSM